MNEKHLENAPTKSDGNTKAPRLRSPNYPVTGLEIALTRMNELYDVGRGHYVPITTARETWQYQKAAGDRLVAALKAYGLIEVTGEGGDKRQIRPSESGTKILEKHSTREQLLKEAALKPDLHRELWVKYQGNLPSDAVVREFLRWDKAFNPETIDKFIKQFRDTIAYANLTQADIIKSNEGVVDDNLEIQGHTPAGSSKGAGTALPFNLSVIPPTIDAPEIGEDVLSFNLSRTGKARIKFNGQVTQEAIRKLIALLDLSIDTYPTQAELTWPTQAINSIVKSDTGIPENELDFEK